MLAVRSRPQSALLGFAMVAASLPQLDARPSLGLATSIGGCAAIVGRDTCELPVGVAKTLSVWVAASWASSEADRITLAGASQTKPVQFTRVASGTRIDVPLRLAQATGSLGVFVGDELVLRIALRGSPEWPWQREIAALSSRETLALLEPQLPRATGAERSRLARAIAESAIAVGQRRRGIDALVDGARVALAAERYSEARSHWLRLAYHQSEAHDFATAETALTNARAVPNILVDADGEAALSYVSAAHAAELRDLSGAAREYERAQAWVERGATLMAPQVAVGRAVVAEQQGRLREALELLERALESSLASSLPCFRALATARAGWYALELNPEDTSSATAIAARTRLREAAALYAKDCNKAPPAEPALAELYLGFAALKSGRIEEARREIVRAGDFSTAPRLGLWRRLLMAEAWLAEGCVDDAERAFREVEASARQLLSSELEWRAAEGVARTWKVRGRLDTALVEFERADALLVASLDWVPLDAGALQFLSSHRETAEGLAATLLELGRIPEAFSALRRARRRFVVELARRADALPSAERRSSLSAHLQARDAIERLAARLETCPGAERASLEAQLATEQQRARAALQRLTEELRKTSPGVEEPLRVPERGEALLLWTQIKERWHGFLEFDGSVQHVAQTARPDGADWLTPFARRLAEARQLTVISEGPLAGLELHAIARSIWPELRVAYSLDLPMRASPSEKGAAFVAADPLGDLPNARLEAKLIAEQLARTGERVAVLMGEGLGMREFERQIARAQRLHYAGHAAFLGDDGWQSQVQLARGTITPVQILSFSRVPEEVVFSACSAAKDAGLVHSQSLGVAQAFLLAGARRVIAPTRRVSDIAARRFSVELWSGVAAGLTLPAAYHAALAPLPAEDERWAFRLLLP